MLPAAHHGLYYTNFLVEMVMRREVRRYLEIGVYKGHNLARIQVETAIAIDPAFNLEVDPTVLKKRLLLHRMTSDAFFRDAREHLAIEFAFLDGMHLFEYLLRDIANTESHCQPGAVIAIHDAMPLTEQMVERVNRGGAWTGDVWKVVPILQEYRPDIKITLVDCAPTGLVCLSNLDSHSRILKEKYDEIVLEYFKRPNDVPALEEYYATHSIASAESILNLFDHTLFFGI